ncbi:lipase 3-like [Adelges cooleyi]|uniref:lipase 3-like n=1 Tax=Adelges cooleyi TaxID=133065 RepID=UPI00217F2C9D|nr:lipase 3-like [Adelges cooleyi]
MNRAHLLIVCLSLFAWTLCDGARSVERKSPKPFATTRQQLWRTAVASDHRPLTRRNWRANGKPGYFGNDHVLARRQWNYMTSTVLPAITRPWKSLSEKLESNSMWPGMSRIANEAYLLNTTEDFIREQGYPVERHTVITTDGYNLTVHRIPYSKKADPTIKRPVVVVQHGILCSSTDWVISGPNSSLGYVLSDAGYDVWITNTRGNTYSRGHVTLDPSKDAEKFWDFSWHEMGVIDMPNMIDYILEVTGEPDVSYVGHSMGNAIFYVMCSERPEYAQKVRAMASMAPIAFLNHVKSPILTFLASVADPLAWLCGSLGYYEFRPNGKILLFAGKAFCESSYMPSGVCDNLLFLIAGYDSKRLVKNVLPIILAHTPAGASARQLTHFAQLINRNQWFGQYNFNKEKNMEKYGQLEPPAYNLSKVTVPVALYYANNDWMAAPEDVQVLGDKLPNLVEKREMPYREFNHLDFLWATDVKTIVYDDLIRFLNRYDRKYLTDVKESQEVDNNVFTSDLNEPKKD